MRSGAYLCSQYIAEKLLKINECGLWSDTPTDPALQDEQIFQTAKLVKSVIICLFVSPTIFMLFHSCGHFMSVIMGDYVAGFLGSSEGCNWNMNAFDVRYDPMIPLCCR